MRIVFNNGGLQRLGEAAHELGFKRTLIVSDRGIVSAGFASRAANLLNAEGITAIIFSDFESNPDSRMIEAGRVFAASHDIDSIVALGGGSSLDTAKGINFVLTNGGSMRDYRGFGKAAKPMLPGIGIPTTAGTGSEAQSYALISDADTHAKMACGDPKAMFQVVILDPELTVTQPRTVTATAGFDAISHAVESFVTTKCNATSDALAHEAWNLLNENYERVLSNPADVAARGAMLLGAHKAGAAIENSMLGATHACANPLTAHYGTTHAVAIAVMLPHVVRWNSEVAGNRYGALYSGDLAARVDQLATVASLPRRLRDIGVPRDDLPALAAGAVKEWTGAFNPRPLDAAAALYLYEQAY